MRLPKITTACVLPPQKYSRDISEHNYLWQKNIISRSFYTRGLHMLISSTFCERKGLGRTVAKLLAAEVVLSTALQGPLKRQLNW